RKVELPIIDLWKQAAKKSERRFPHEYFYELIRSGALAKEYQTDPKHSWLVAAAEANLPLFVPGWEDSTIGNVFAAQVLREEVPLSVMKTGVEYMIELIGFYRETSKQHPIGFFQIGGGIAGDFSL